MGDPTTAVPTTTDVPSYEPTPTPSEPPTQVPSNVPITTAPSGCATSAARLHITFKGLAETSRRLLVAIVTAELASITLQHALAKELGLAPEELEMLDVEKTGAGGKTLKIVAMFSKDTSSRFEEAIKLGYALEQQVLSGAFNPLPNFPIHRLVMEEIFHCQDDF